MKSRFLKAAGAIALSACFMLSAMAEGQAARDTEPGCPNYNPPPSSVTIDARTGSILSQDGIDEQRHPASLTKIMAALLAFDAVREGRIGLDDRITVNFSSSAMKKALNESKSAWLRNGSQIKVREALSAITVASANNVTVALAESLAGTEADFVALMNEKAEELGMTKTVFKNSTGLPDDEQVTTARDMAKLTRHIYSAHPEYLHFFSQPRAEFGPYRGASARYNHNELAVLYPYIDGLKTGYICDAGYNLALSGVRDGDRVITVVFGGRTPHKRNMRARELLDEGFRAIIANRAETRVSGRNPLPNIEDGPKTKLVLKEGEAREPALRP